VQLYTLSWVLDVLAIPEGVASRVVVFPEEIKCFVFILGIDIQSLEVKKIESCWWESIIDFFRLWFWRLIFFFSICLLCWFSLWFFFLLFFGFLIITTFFRSRSCFTLSRFFFVTTLLYQICKPIAVSKEWLSVIAHYLIVVAYVHKPAYDVCKSFA
jgi:hypothetical protein